MNNLRKLRERKGLSLREMGAIVEMSASVLGNYERADRQPSMEVWSKLADFFDVSVPYLIGIEENQGDMVSIPKAEYDELLAIKEQMEVIKEMLR